MAKVLIDKLTKLFINLEYYQTINDVKHQMFLLRSPSLYRLMLFRRELLLKNCLEKQTQFTLDKISQTSLLKLWRFSEFTYSAVNE